MNKVLAVVLAASFGVSVSACRDDAPVDAGESTATETPEQLAPPAGPASATSAAAPAQVVMPVTVSADAVTVGKAVGPDGGVTTSMAKYSVNDTVYASIPTSGRAPLSDVSVYWSYQDGTSHKQERKQIPSGEKYVNFSFAKADGLRPGKYTVQVDVGDVPVGIMDFSVQ